MLSRKFVLPYLSLLLLVWLSSVAGPSAHAQVLYGSVVGTVTDQSQALIPGATVTITSKDTGVSRETTSDQGGRYSFGNVLPGNYDLKVVAKGFRTSAVNNIDVSPNTVGRVDLRLEVGQITEQVTVEASAVALQTDKSDTHTEITTKAITSLPLSGYRNYQSLINLVPGATPAAFQNSITDTPGRALQTHINGGNAQTNITRIDGATSVNVWLPHHVGYVTPEETIDVVNITTSSADAEQGMAGSSAITLVTKSGTNQIHGSAFEFHDDQHFNARNFFQAAGTAKPLSIYNNFGGTVGGPIKKNKLFYFLSYDGTRQRQASPGFYTVPTARSAGRRFQRVSHRHLRPEHGQRRRHRAHAVCRQHHSDEPLDPIAQKIQCYYPAAEFPGADTLEQLLRVRRPDPEPQLLRCQDQLHGSTTNSRSGASTAACGRSRAARPYSASPAVPASAAQIPGLGDTLIQVATIGHTHTFSPHLLLDGVLGYERQGQHVIPNDFGTNYGQQFGIPNTNGPDPLQSGFPNISVPAYTGFGVPNWMPLQRVEESYTHSDNLTWTKGAHEIRFGFDLVRHHLNHWQPEIGNSARAAAWASTAGNRAERRRGAQPVQRLRGFPAGAFRRLAEKSLQYILSTGPRMAVRLVRPRPLAGEPEPDRQHRPALRVLPADDARRQGHRTARSLHQPGLPGRPRQRSGKRRHQRSATSCSLRASAWPIVSATRR